jgi:hypothetical protein
MKYGSPKQLPDGRYFVKVSTDEDGRVLFQLNNVKLVNKFSESDTVTLDLSSCDQEDKLTKVDQANIEKAKECSEQWFGRKVADKTLESAYVSDRDGTLFEASKIVSKSTVLTRVFDHTKTHVESDTLEADTVCNIMIEFTGLWFMKKSFGPVWRVVQILLKAPPKQKKPRYTEECMFEDEPDPEVDIEESDDDDYQ